MTILETERLQLRRLELGDAEFILRLLNDPSFHRFIGDKGVRTLADAREYLATGPIASYERHGFGLYLVTLSASAAPIGICGLVRREGLADVDVGFAFLPAHWSRGYASEAAGAVLAYGHERLRLGRIVAITAAENRASIAVLEKIGLKFERMITLTEGAAPLKLFVPA